MTHSKQQRLANIDLALEIIFSRLGDRSVNGVAFEIFDQEFKDIFPTTWRELESRALIELNAGTMDGNRAFIVTGEAWAFWVEKCGLMDDYRKAAITVCKAAKAHIEGRSDDGCVMLEELARDSSLPKNLVENIIESRLLERLFPEKEVGIYWWDHVKGMAIRVPSQLGMEYL